MPPLFQALALADAGVHNVYVGDPALTDRSWERLGSLVRDDLVALTAPLRPVHPGVLDALTGPEEHSRERFGGQPLPGGR
jgi:hypothetical protein